MPLCAFVGDSIALGLALAAPVRCDRAARVGRAPAAILRHTPRDAYLWAVISAGTNPAGILPDAATLRAIRAKVSAGRVIWVLPAAARRAATVAGVASERGDRVVPLGPTCRDRIHPRSYRRLWRRVAEALETGR